VEEIRQPIQEDSMSRVNLEPLNLTITNHNAGTIEVSVDGNPPTTLNGRCTNLYVATDSIAINAAPIPDEPELEPKILDDPTTWPPKRPDEPPVVGEH
jgi:hypothetical protein